MYDSMNYPSNVKYPTAKQTESKPVSVINVLLDEDQLTHIVYWQAIETQNIQTAQMKAEIESLDGNWAEYLKVS